MDTHTPAGTSATMQEAGGHGVATQRSTLPSFLRVRRSARGATGDQLILRGRFFSTRRRIGTACRADGRNPRAVRVIAARGGTLPWRRRAPSANQRASAWLCRHWPMGPRWTPAGRPFLGSFAPPSRLLLFLPPFPPFFALFSSSIQQRPTHTLHACLRIPPPTLPSLPPPLPP